MGMEAIAAKETARRSRAFAKEEDAAREERTAREEESTVEEETEETEETGDTEEKSEGPLAKKRREKAERKAAKRAKILLAVEEDSAVLEEARAREEKEEKEGKEVKEGKEEKSGKEGEEVKEEKGEKKKKREKKEKKEGETKNTSAGAVEAKNDARKAVWVGNLSFSTTEEELLAFFGRCGAVARMEHVQQKGFARVYFAESASVARAVLLSESVLGGRKLLIKCAVDYTRGKNKRAKTDGDTSSDKQDTSRDTNRGVVSSTLFVGNLSFNSTMESLQVFFGRYGPIMKVRLATFQDSGKCKGFAYIDYTSEQSAVKCMRAVSSSKGPSSGDGRASSTGGGPRIDGRVVRIEYASTAATQRGRPWENKPNKESEE